MKQYISLAFLILCSFLLANCDEDSFSTVVEVDLSEYGNQMVVLSPFKVDIPFQAYLVKSNDILKEDLYFEAIENPTIEIFEEGKLLTSLNNKLESGYYTSPNKDIAPQEDKNYRIEVSSPEFGKATANTYVPKRAYFKNAYISNENYYDPIDDREKVEITFEIEDNATVENYYYLTVNTVYEADQSSFVWDICFYTSDPIFDEEVYNDGFIEVEESAFTYYCGGFTTFRDLIFEGQQTQTVKIYLDQYDVFDYRYDPITQEETKVRRKIELVLGAMSRDIYNYERSAESQSWNQDNPFAEPIRVYSNIEGGIGIFGGFVESVVTL